MPERGTLVDDASLQHLVLLKMPERQLQNDLSLPRGILVH